MLSAMIGSACLLFAVAIYFLISLGFPLGEFAMGGKYKVLPISIRVACAVSILIQLFAMAVLLQTGNVFTFGIPAILAKGACYFFTVYLFLNTILNCFSRSHKERYFTTPLSFVTAMCFLIVSLNA